MPGPVVLEFGAVVPALPGDPTPNDGACWGDIPKSGMSRSKTGQASRWAARSRVKLWPTLVFMRNGAVRPWP